MAKLEEIKVNSVVRGIASSSAVTIKHVQMFGEQALEVTYVDGEGKANTQLLFRDQESSNADWLHRPRLFSSRCAGAVNVSKTGFVKKSYSDAAKPRPSH